MTVRFVYLIYKDLFYINLKSRMSVYKLGNSHIVYPKSLRSETKSHKLINMKKLINYE